METQLVIFLAFTSAAVIINAVLLLLVYKSFSSLTLKLTNSMREFQTNPETKAGVESLLIATQTLNVATEAARDRLREFEPILAQAQDRYGFFLAKTDRKVEKVSEEVVDKAARVRDAVANPAHNIGALVAGVITVLGPVKDWQDEN